MNGDWWFVARPDPNHHPPPTNHHSPPTIHHPLSTTHYPPLTNHYPPPTNYNIRMPVRLVAIDIDGTLLDSSGSVPARNVAAIEAVVARGVVVALVTGRSFPFARPVLDGLPDELELIVSNGALVKTREGVTIRRRLLPRVVALTILDGTRSFRDAVAVVFDRSDDGHIVTEHMDWDHPNRRGYYEHNRERIRRSEPLEDALTEDPVQVMFNGSMVAMQQVEDVLGRHPDASRFQILTTEYARHDFTLLDVLAEGCTKGTALAEWAGARGIARHEVMAIGDNFNDREMLEYAGVPVIMENAVDDLKASGWHVTASNDDAGVAAALETFVPG